VDVLKVTHSGLGFAPELAFVNFPVTLFVAESDLTPLKERIEEFTYGLTKWEPEVTETAILTPPKVTVEGKDYEEAVANMNRLFLRNQWSDGVPLLPATKERVDWILTGTDLPRDKEIARVGPRGGIATVESIAVPLAMTGGRPEYLPVLIAIVEGLGDPEFKTASWQTTSRGTFLVAIVNGPIGKQIRLSKTFGCLGPDSQRPAGVRIGRAVRLILQDMGGATPGSGTMSCYGPNRTTNVVISEDEENLPAGWEPLNTEYGYARGTNSVLLNVSCLAVNMWRRGNYIGETLEEEQDESFDVVAWYMRIPPKSYPVEGGGRGKGSPVGIYLINSLVAEQMASVGWTKESIRQTLWERTHTPLAEYLTYGREVRKLKYDNPGIDLATLPDPMPMYEKPENLLIAIAGGRHPSQNFWLGEGRAVCPTAEIQLPAIWDQLIAEAEEDLGPIPIDP